MKNNRSRAAAQSAHHKRRKRRRRGKMTLHYILLLMFLLSVGVTLSLTVFFKTKMITVVGCDKYSVNEIIETSGIKNDVNMFKISSKEVSKSIKDKYPYIEDVRLIRRFSGTVEINLTQYEPKAAVVYGNEYLLITREGKVLEKGNVFIPEHVPVIKGIEAKGIKEGDDLGEKAKESMITLDYIFKAIEDSDFPEITNVDLSDSLNIKIIYEARLLFMMGTEVNLKEKFDFIKNRLEVFPPDQKGIVDVSSSRGRKLVLKPMDDDAFLKEIRGDKLEKQNNKTEETEEKNTEKSEKNADEKEE